MLYNLKEKFSEKIKLFNSNKKYYKNIEIIEKKTQNNQIKSGFIITKIGPEGILLDTPGTYIFANDIVWSPKEIIAILIIGDNIILDMNNFSLTCINPNKLETIGINSSFCKNLIIKNGNIIGMGFNGIISEICENVTIENIIIEKINTNNIAKYTTPSGIKLSECTNIKINKCIVKNITVRVGNFTAFDIVLSNNSIIKNCLVNKCVNLDGALVGYSQYLCYDSIIENSNACNLQTFFGNNTKTQGHTCIGFVPFFSENLKFLNCSAKNIIGTCDDAHGFSMFVCVGPILISKCTVNNVRDGVGKNTGAKATGIEIYAENVIVKDCIVSNIMAINPQDKQCTGFSVSGSVGQEAKDVKFINCKAINVNVYNKNKKQNSCIGYGTGFGSPPDPRPTFQYPCSNITYEKCCAKKCQVGFDSWWQKNSLWKNNISCDCGISILNLNNSQRTVSCNLCSECNPPIIVTLDNVAKNNKFINNNAFYS